LIYQYTFLVILYDQTNFIVNYLHQLTIHRNLLFVDITLQSNLDVSSLKYESVTLQVANPISETTILSWVRWLEIQNFRSQYYVSKTEIMTTVLSIFLFLVILFGYFHLDQYINIEIRDYLLEDLGFLLISINQIVMFLLIYITRIIVGIKYN
jgi:hypothetical protein